jgi:hypothetical protein
MGESLYYTGPSVTFESGDAVEHGQRGEVMGPGNDYRGLQMMFAGNRANVCCPLDELSQSPPIGKGLRDRVDAAMKV